MMERPSICQNCILKRTACQGDTDLHSAATNMFKWCRAITKRPAKCRNLTAPPVLTATPSQSPPLQMATKRTAHLTLSP
jgi:hypothetical protein